MEFSRNFKSLTGLTGPNVILACQTCTAMYKLAQKSTFCGQCCMISFKDILGSFNLITLRLMVILNDYDTIKEAFLKRGDEFAEVELTGENFIDFKDGI